MPRLFVALELPDAVNDALDAIGADAAIAHARWEPRTRRHVTLRFLGQVDAARASTVERALGAVVSPSFDLAIAGLGRFPDASQNARVLWAAVVPHAPIVGLKNAMDAALGPDPEHARGFVPHISLARVEGARADDVDAWLARHAHLATAPWRVSSFALYASTATDDRQGVRYTVLRRFGLDS